MNYLSIGIFESLKYPYLMQNTQFFILKRPPLLFHDIRPLRELLCMTQLV